MYVTVRFGEGQEAIFNPDCHPVALLRSIRDTCLTHDDVTSFVQPDVDIELADERGNIKYLRDTHSRYASEVLSDKEILVLLRVDKLDGAYTPLLKDEDAITEDFLARLCVREEAGGLTDERPDSSRGAKSNTRRSPADNLRDRDGRRSKAEQRAGRPAKLEKQNSRSRSRQGK